MSTSGPGISRIRHWSCPEKLPSSLNTEDLTIIESNGHSCDDNSYLFFQGSDENEIMGIFGFLIANFIGSIVY